MKGAEKMTEKWPSEYPGTNWINDEEEAAVLDVVRRRSLFRYYGPSEPTHVSMLESRAREFYGSKYALAVNGGTGALITAMIAMGIGPGDEVIVPAFLWVSTVGAVIQCNAIPVLCEVDDSFSMDPRDLEKKITPHTRLIVPVHMAGSPCDMGFIMKAADRRGIAVLEDCAQCNGGSFQGRRVGTHGTAGIFSFQINKNITAGEGGLLVTDDKGLYWRMVAAHDLGVPWKNAEPAASDPVITWGQGRRMAELCGAVAAVQLKKLPGIVSHMRASAMRIRESLEGLPSVELRRLNDVKGYTGPFIIMMFADEKAARQAAAGINSSGLSNAQRVEDYGMHIYFNIPQLVNRVPLSKAGNPWSLPANRDMVRDYAKGACPASDALFARSVIIGVPSHLSHDQEQRMIDAISRAAAISV
jgi:8-amino-3,8-dideoxy-alpha-D-manno-octulosonate transaminase